MRLAEAGDVTLLPDIEHRNAPFYSRIGFTVVDVTELTPDLRRVTRKEAEQGLPPELWVAVPCDL